MPGFGCVASCAAGTISFRIERGIGKLAAILSASPLLPRDAVSLEWANMRGTILLLCLGVLAGCSLGPAVDADVTDYFRVNDLAANRIILLNILRARDGAPLHFSELSLVRGQITAGVNASVTFPFGPLLHATAPRRLGGIIGTVSSAPSFDVGSLDTQDFTRGVMAPIAPATLKFFLDEGIDYRLVLLLLVSGVRTRGNQEVILNEPGSARQVCYSRDVSRAPANALPRRYTIIAEGEPCLTGSMEPEFFAFLRVLNHLRRVYATNYAVPPRPVGPPFTIDMRAALRAVAAMDPARYQLERLPSGQYQLVAAEHRDTIVLCQEPAQGIGPPTYLAALRNEAGGPRIPANACAPHGGAAAALREHGTEDSEIALLTIRSTLEVIRYIGRILAIQDEFSRPRAERCVTLGFEGHNPGCNGNILFHLTHDRAGAPFGIEYRGAYWTVPAPRPCTVSTSCDHTLETMAILSLLLNQNKSAKDIPSTPAFQAVP